MGRRPTKIGAIPRLRERKRGMKIHYYYDLGGKPRKELPLGSDYGAAIMKYAELSETDLPPTWLRGSSHSSTWLPATRSTSSQGKRLAPSATT